MRQPIHVASCRALLSSKKTKHRPRSKCPALSPSPDSAGVPSCCGFASDALDKHIGGGDGRISLWLRRGPRAWPRRALGLPKPAAVKLPTRRATGEQDGALRARTRFRGRAGAGTRGHPRARALGPAAVDRIGLLDAGLVLHTRLRRTRTRSTDGGSDQLRELRSRRTTCRARMRAQEHKLPKSFTCCFA
jgi:hypothetical protein